MKRLLLSALAGLAIVGLVAAAPASGGKPVPSEAARFAEKEFSFKAKCTIKCVGGQCREYCEGGSVFAIDEGDARFKAELQLRRDAGREGTVVEGTVEVSVKLKF
jgi:hypothetical protein